MNAIRHLRPLPSMQSNESRGYMKVYKVQWVTPSYSTSFGLAGSWLMESREKLFASKEAAEAFVEALRDSAFVLDFQNCNPTIVEFELE
jgi:hypothetical protein